MSSLPVQEMPVLIGLTGGIASGKSTVSSIFRTLGVEVIDADALARQVVEAGQPALAEIREAFGDDVIRDDGGLNRQFLAKIVFDDPTARARLEAITHPRIAEAMVEAARQAAAAGHRWVIYDAALIVEKGHHHWLDSLIVVAASPQTQIARVQARDGLSREEALARLDAQMPLEDKVVVATFVIENEGPIEETRRQVVELHHLIAARVAARGTARQGLNVDETGTDEP